MTKKAHLDDPEDIEAFEAYKRGKLKPLSNSKALIASARKAATNFRLKKEARVNIRLTEGTLEEIKARAEDEGIPYQTLIASVLHKFVSGRLVDKRN